MPLRNLPGEESWTRSRCTCRILARSRRRFVIQQEWPLQQAGRLLDVAQCSACRFKKRHCVRLPPARALSVVLAPSCVPAGQQQMGRRTPKASVAAAPCKGDLSTCVCPPGTK